MVDLSQQVKELKNKVEKMADLINRISQKLTHLKGGKQIDHEQIKVKEKELEDWRAKLEVCQQEKKQIDKEIKEKVQELEKSQLSNTEKQEKINKLLTEHSQELEELDNLIYDERSQYRNIRDKLINELCRPCRGCKEKNAILLKVNHKADNLITTIWIMLVLFFLFHI